MSSRTLHEIMDSVTSQTTRLLRLPDLPGHVVEVHSVIGHVQSFSANTAVSYGLYHNTDLGVTLGMNTELAGQWAHLEMPVDTDAGPPATPVFHFPVPYELIGVQRWDMAMSGGTITALISIVYTLRREPNKTLWNAIRRRTSFERS